MSIAESDWKEFRKLREVALDRLCGKILREIEELSTKSERTNHERYRDIYRLIENRDRDIARAFDEPRRSTAQMQLLAMLNLKIVTPEEMKEFSGELQENINRRLKV